MYVGKIRCSVLVFMYKQSASTAVPRLCLELCEKLEVALLDFCRPENTDIYQGSKIKFVKISITFLGFKSTRKRNFVGAEGDE